MPVVTLFLVALNLAVYALEKALGGDGVCAAYGFVPAHASLGSALSSLFLHDPDNLFHLGGNLVFLVLFGALVEKALGSLMFSAVFILAGMGGAGMHCLVDPNSATPLVGCSGALFGLLALAGVLRPHLLGFVVAYAGINVWEAFHGGSGGVSFGCHIGGFVVGVAVAGLMKVSGSDAIEAT